MRATEQYTFFNESDDFLSQLFLCKFQERRIEYNCAEQFVMVKKSVLFGDQESIVNILDESIPQKQFELGRKIKNINEKKWLKEAKIILYKGNYLKFKQNPKLMEKLLQTDETDIIYASTTDNVFGIGLAEDDPKIIFKKYWKGTNWLGETLTTLRDDFLLFGEDY